MGKKRNIATGALIFAAAWTPTVAVAQAETAGQDNTAGVTQADQTGTGGGAAGTGGNGGNATTANAQAAPKAPTTSRPPTGT